MNGANAGTGARLRALVINDKEEYRKDIGRSLEERAGYEVDSAIDGKNALRMVAPGKYAVIVCDQRMPGMSGAELIPKIKKISPGQLVVMLSDDVGLFDDERRASIEADAYIDYKSRGNWTQRLLDTVKRVRGY